MLTTRPQHHLLRAAAHRSALALLFAWQPAWADTHVFYDGVPILTVSKSGSFEHLALSSQDEDGRQRPSRIARSLKFLWEYDRGGNPTRRAVLKVNLENYSLGCTVPDSVVVEGGQDKGLLTSRPLKGRLGSERGEPSPAEADFARHWLRAALARESLAPAWRARAADAALVTAVALRNRERKSLIVELPESVGEGTATVSVFAILTPSADSRFVVGYSDIRKGGASDSESFAGAATFLDNADLDGDGTDEVFVRHSGYESSGIGVLTRGVNDWGEAVSVSEGGC